MPKLTRRKYMHGGEDLLTSKRAIEQRIREIDTEKAAYVAQLEQIELSINPCKNKDTGHVSPNRNCNGMVDGISGEPITSGYCLEKDCLDKQTIQTMRLRHILPSQDNHLTARFLKRQIGDAQNPFTRSNIPNQAFVEAGLPDPTLDDDYNDDSDYQASLAAHREEIERRDAFNRLGRGHRQRMQRNPS
jgi:hypothetical protein